MAELSLEPYAAVQHWRLPGADGRWELILAEYLQTLAQRCAASGPAVIGHIKALALFPGGGYVRVSAVAPDIPASVEGKTPSGCTELELTLNVLVYGLERAAIERITRETSAEMAERWKGSVSLESLSQAGQHAHPAQHQHQGHEHRE